MTVARRKRVNQEQPDNRRPLLLRYLETMPKLLFAAAAFIAAMTALIAEVFAR